MTYPILSSQLAAARAARSVLGLVALALLLAAWSPGGAAAAKAPRCLGKPATLVSNAATILGSRGNDVIVAGPGDNEIRARGGNDTICAGRGDDRIHGGRGNDNVNGGAGDDVLRGGRGSDRLRGGAGSDRLLGEAGNDDLGGGVGRRDQLDGGPGDDRLSGGPGRLDVLVGGPGNDRIDGGPGAHDVASYADLGGPVRIDLGAGTVNGAESERLSGIEDVLGGPGNDTLIGSPGSANRLDGGPGNDSLIAAGVDDQAHGGPGNDACAGFTIEVSCGPTANAGGTVVETYRSIDRSTSLIVAGRRGGDEISVEHSAGTYTVRGARGPQPVRLGDPAAGTCRRDRESNSVSCSGSVNSIQASLGAGDDSFRIAASVPAAVAATIDGGRGSDTLVGGRGDDTIYGGDDRAGDVLAGGGGDDVLYGVNIFHPRREGGAARMFGGRGNDLLIGGQPCNGDHFDGGPGSNDSASFARVRNSGIVVRATIGGAVLDPDVPACRAGRITGSVEKIEGSPGPDVLTGNGRGNTLLGRGGNDRLDGRGGFDTCVGGNGRDRLRNCEYGNRGARFSRVPPPG